MAITPRARIGRQLRELVAGTAFLERCGELQVLELQEDLGAGTMSDSVRDATQGVAKHLPAQALGGLPHVGDVDHGPDCAGKYP
jgi:hypothetical protein